jgi:hypothetical protein
MELAIYLIIEIIFIILFGYISYKLWLLFFDTKFGMINKRMKIASKLFGILWPITLPILIIITIVHLLK